MALNRPLRQNFSPFTEFRQFERTPPGADDEYLFVRGKPGQWYGSTVADDLTWDTSREARLFLKAAEGTGNLLTGAINLVGGLFGQEPDAVPLEDQVESALLLEVGGEIDIPFSLAQRSILPVYREFVDPTFNPIKAGQKWAEDNPTLVTVLEQNGYDINHIVRDTNNEQWFKYQINYTLATIQARQRIEMRNARIGTGRWALEGFADNFVAYVVADPTVGPSLLFGGGALKAEQASSRFADDILRGGRALTRARVPASETPLLARTAAEAVRHIGRAPAVVHRGLASRLGYAGAMGAEFAAVGAVIDFQAQQDAMERWNQIFGGTEMERAWSWEEFFLATGLTGALGYVLGGALGGFHPDRVAHAREALASTTGDINDITARRGFNPDTVVLSHSADRIKQRIANRIESLAPSVSEDSADIGWILDPKMLDEAGLFAHQVEEVIENLLTAAGDGGMSRHQLLEFLADFYQQAKAYNQANNFGIPTTGLTAVRYRQIFQELSEQAMRDLRLLGEGAEVPEKFRPGTPGFTREIHRRTIEELERTAGLTGLREAIPRDLGTITGWQREFRELSQTSLRRSLSMGEEERLLELERNLAANNAVPDMGPDFAFTTRNIPDPATEFGLRQYKGKTPAGRAVRQLVNGRQRLFQAEAAIRRAKRQGGKAASDTALAPLIEETKKAKRAIKGARTQLNKFRAPGGVGGGPGGPDAPADTVASVAERLAAKPPGGRDTRIRGVTNYLRARDNSDHTLIRDIHALATLMRAWGLGDFFAFLATQKTGQFHTVRSAFTAIRMAADFVDSSRFKVEALGPSGPIHAGTLADVQRNAQKQVQKLNGLIARMWEKKLIRNRRDWRTLQRATIRHIRGIEESTDSRVLQLAEEWRKISRAATEEGLANGRLVKGETEDPNKFFPFRVNVGVARRRAPELHRILTDSLLKHYQTSDVIHLDTLVALGWAKRTGKRRVKYLTRGPLKGRGTDETGEILQEGRFVKSMLSESELRAYEDALVNLRNANGDTAVEASAWRSIEPLLNRRTFDQGRDGRILFFRPGGAKSAQERMLVLDLLLQDPRIEPFVDWNFIDLAFDYSRTSLFDIKAQTAVQRMFPHIPELTVTEFFDAVETVARETARKGTDDVDKIQAGIGQLRAKHALMSGRQPRILSDSESVGEIAAELATAGTTAVYGAGIGHLVAQVELMIQSFARIYDVRELGDNLHSMFRAIVTHKHFSRENLGDLANGIRLQRHANAERFTTGNVGSSFHYRVRDKFVEPWEDFYRTLTGRTAPGGVLRNRAAATAVQGVKALGKTMLMGGGSDYFTNAARSMAAYTLQRESARFLPAARRLAALLEANEQALREANRAARNSARQAGKNEAEAIRAGNLAQFKLWKSLTRKAGFGGHWQIARRFAEHGLLNRANLDTFTEFGLRTGSIKIGRKNGMDLTEMAQHLADATPEERNVVGRMIDQMQNSWEDVIRRRISEQGPLQTPTDPASLVYHGKVVNAMFGFSRSFVDNNVIELAALPQRESLSLIGAFIFTEATTRIARRLLKGESIDDLEQEWRDRPTATLAKYMLNVPFLGQMNPYLQMAADAAFGGKRFQRQAGASAATSVHDQMLNLGLDALAAPVELMDDERRGPPRVIRGLDKLSTQLVPGLGAFRRAVGDDSVRRTHGRSGVGISYERARKAREYTDFRSLISQDEGIETAAPEFDLADFFNPVSEDVTE